MSYIKIIAFILVLISTALPSRVDAIDIVQTTKGHSNIDERNIYDNEILITALEKTKQAYGDFRIELIISKVQRERALLELIKGDRLNVFVAVTQNKWESKTLPIRIPILKGLLGYRLFLIKKQNENKFSKITSSEELKELKVGQGQQWATTKILNTLGFKLVTGSDYEGLFKMLMRERFDYFPRGVNEIFSELEKRKESMPEMEIEPRLALYIPSPSYFFVSPKYPRLAKRIEAGLKIMIKDGSFDEIFWKHHGQNIKKSELKKRTIISFENPLLSPKTPFKQKNLWFDPHGDI